MGLLDANFHQAVAESSHGFPGSDPAQRGPRLRAGQYQSAFSSGRTRASTTRQSMSEAVFDKSKMLHVATTFAPRTPTIRRSELQEMLLSTSRPGLLSFALGLPAAELFPV